MELSASGRKRILRGIILKLITLAGALYGIHSYLAHSNNVLFVFTYYTNISNAFMAIVLIAAVLLSIISLAIGRTVNAQWLYVLKFCASVSMIVTFLVYALALAPNYDTWMEAYSVNEYGSLGVHIIAPVFAVLDLFCSDKDYAPRAVHGFYALFLPVLYVAYITVLAVDFGARWPGGMYAPYRFLNFGARTGWFGFAPGKAGSTTTGIGVAYILAGAAIGIFVIAEIVIGLLKLRSAGTDRD